MLLCFSFCILFFSFLNRATQQARQGKRPEEKHRETHTHTNANSLILPKHLHTHSLALARQKDVLASLLSLLQTLPLQRL